MPISNYLAEEALSLPPTQRVEHAKLMIESLGLREDSRSDGEIRGMLSGGRLADLIFRSRSLAYHLMMYLRRGNEGYFQHALQA